MDTSTVNRSMFHNLFAYFSMLYPFQIPRNTIENMLFENHCCECARICCQHGFDQILVCQAYMDEGFCCYERYAAARIRQAVISQRNTNKNMLMIAGMLTSKFKRHPYYTPDAVREVFTLVQNPTHLYCKNKECLWCVRLVAHHSRKESVL